MDATVKVKKPGAQSERGHREDACATSTIKTVGVIGAGQMGNGIAHVVALAGYEVALNDVRPEAVEQARGVIERNMRRQVSRGIITDAQMRAALARIGAAPDLDAIGTAEWTGTPLREFLRRIGADTRAKYVHFTCAEGYSSSIDMATALHPQTQLTFKYDGEILPTKFGFPMRVRIPTKLGFKNPKHVVGLTVLNTYTGGYWEDQGYNWFSGL